jgi:hypothetical protein
MMAWRLLRTLYTHTPCATFSHTDIIVLDMCACVYVFECACTHSRHTHTHTHTHTHVHAGEGHAVLARGA